MTHAINDVGLHLSLHVHERHWLLLIDHQVVHSTQLGFQNEMTRTNGAVQDLVKVLVKLQLCQGKAGRWENKKLGGKIDKSPGLWCDRRSQDVLHAISKGVNFLWYI